MRTKTLLFIVFIFGLSSLSHAQEKYMLLNSEVSFFSSAPLEDIEAVCKTAVGLVNEADNHFSFRVAIRDFTFKSALMQEHFNENYMESEKFPLATFKGEIAGNYSFEEPGTHLVTAHGELTIHGVTHEVDLPVTIQIDKKSKHISSVFNVRLEDYDIEIPSVVFQNIAEVVEVKVGGDMQVMK